MESKERVTAVTTVTRKRDIPPLRVVQKGVNVSLTLLRNPARGDAPKSGYSGYGGYRGGAERRAGAKSRKRPPKCSSCGQRIPRSEFDYVLESLLTGKKRAYHERCVFALAGKIASKHQTAYRLTHRHINAETN